MSVTSGNIVTPANERVMTRINSIVEGQYHELVVTDQAVYFQSRIRAESFWITAALCAVGNIIGLALHYKLLSQGRILVRHTLDQIDSVTTRSVPRMTTPLAGAVLALLFGVNVGLATKNPWLGYGLGSAICLAAGVLMVRLQQSFLVVSSQNNQFIFKSFNPFDELLGVQDSIWEARRHLLARLSGELPTPPSPAPSTAVGEQAPPTVATMPKS